MSASDEKPLFLGLDASTQALKASLLHSDLSVHSELEVRFDRDLPHHGTRGGTLMGPQGSGIVYSPVMIVVEAVDLLFERIKAAAWPVQRIRGVSAAGQQHASVYWSYEAQRILANVDADKPLTEQLKGAFSRDQIPNWQDSSTLDECAYIEQHVGGPDKLARLTGSKAHARFTGPQILRFRHTQPHAYAETWRISLVSSFLTTLLSLDGEVKAIDESDACGMNMYDMSTPERGWAAAVLDVIAGDAAEGSAALKAKLGAVESDGGRVVGHVGAWYVQRYGFSPDCVVCPGTGDNPATFLSFTLRDSEALLSLGTSDTVLVSTSTYNPDPQFHAFFHPAQIVPPNKDEDQQSATAASTSHIQPMQYFNMLVYKNGSLAREHVRDEVYGGSWDRFNRAVEERRPKNANELPSKTAFWWLKAEIIPTNAEGVYKFTSDRSLATASESAPMTCDFESADDNAIAMLESQFLNYRSRSSAILGGAGQLSRVFATGGAAANTTICSLAADVLGCQVCKPVEFDEGAHAWRNAHYNACSVAAAYKAAWAWTRHSAATTERRYEPFASFVKRVADERAGRRGQAPSAGEIEVVEEGVAVVARPDAARAAAYRDSVQWWASLERTALQHSLERSQQSK